MKKCVNCNKPIQDDSVFCRYCGQNVLVKNCKKEDSKEYFDNSGKNSSKSSKRRIYLFGLLIAINICLFGIMISSIFIDENQESLGFVYLLLYGLPILAYVYVVNFSKINSKVKKLFGIEEKENQDVGTLNVEITKNSPHSPKRRVFYFLGLSAFIWIIGFIIVISTYPENRGVWQSAFLETPTQIIYTSTITIAPTLTFSPTSTLTPTFTNTPTISPTSTVSPNLCTRESTLLWRLIADTSISRLVNDLEEWANPNTSIYTLLDRANDMYSKVRGISRVPLCLRAANDNLLDVLYNYKKACKSVSKGDIVEANEDIHFMTLYLEDYILEIGRLQFQYNWEDGKVDSWNGISVGMCEDEVLEILPESEIVGDYEELGRNLYGLGLISKWLYPEVHLVFSNTEESLALCSPFNSLSDIFILDN